MRLIELSATPNQSFSVTLDGNRWDFVIKQAVSSMIADVTLNDVQILAGVRIVAGTPIIPYKYLRGSGNFLILTENEEIPYWDHFDASQQMLYLSYDEIIAIPAAPLEWPVVPAYSLKSTMVINQLAFVLG